MQNIFTENRLLYRNAPSESGEDTSDIQSQAQEVENALADASENSEQAQKSQKKIAEKTEETRGALGKIMNWKTAARITGAAVFAPYLAAEVAYAGYKGTKSLYDNGGKQTAKFVGSRTRAVATTGMSGAREIAGSLAMTPLRGINAGVNGIGAVKNIIFGTTKKIASLIPGSLNLATKPFSYLEIPGAEYLNTTFKDTQGNWSKSGGESYKAAGNNISNIRNRIGETVYDAKNVITSAVATPLKMTSEGINPNNSLTNKIEDTRQKVIHSKLIPNVFSTSENNDFWKTQKSA